MCSSGKSSITAVLAVVLALGCGPTNIDRDLYASHEVERLDTDSPFLKAHMRNGWVYVLENWRVEAETRRLRGEGELLDVNRKRLRTGEFAVDVDSVALFETNIVRQSGATAAMAVITGISVAMTAACIANPKACFGSCPTFFGESGGHWELLAEGFSASIAPCLEATDVDALRRWCSTGPRIELKMTNEALETHVVRWADLLAIPLQPGQSAGITSGGDFRVLGQQVEPVRAVGPDGDCLSELRAMDELERWSLADSLDLATREVIELEFQVPRGGEWGLILGMRQTLMTTYLFYQGLSYLGQNAGSWMARLESMSSGDRQRLGNLWVELGGVEVLVEVDRTFATVEEVSETGPLAIDYDVVELPVLDAGPTRIRLRLVKGLWRIDLAALVQLGERVEPLRLSPELVMRDGAVDGAARESLLDPESTLVTLPGDEYRLVYRLPAGPDTWELFLESRGYYLEWMRDEWMVEENSDLAAKMLLLPRQTLRDLAPSYKAVESTMEELFWGSRYAHP
jgi:hypothetical protein